MFLAFIGVITATSARHTFKKVYAINVHLVIGIKKNEFNINTFRFGK